MASALAGRLAGHAFQPFRIAHLVDSERRYRVDLPADFPFALQLFAYDQAAAPFPLNWHERLELFIPVEGQGTFCMGQETVRFDPGDVLVVDNMKLHGIGAFQGRRRRAIVVSFLPSFVYRLGAPVCDAVLLSPFYPSPQDRPLVLRRQDRIMPVLHDRLVALAETYFAGQDDVGRAGCRVLLLSILYDLVKRLGRGFDDRRHLAARQQQAARLGKLQSFLLDRVHARISVREAGAVVGMGPSTFTRYFKRVTGERFLAYLTRLRLDRAKLLLSQTKEPVAVIASAVGFEDQAYFTRVFRRHFGQTPRDLRARVRP